MKKYVCVQFYRVNSKMSQRIKAAIFFYLFITKCFTSTVTEDTRNTHFEE